MAKFYKNRWGYEHLGIEPYDYFKEFCRYLQQNNTEECLLMLRNVNKFNHISGSFGRQQETLLHAAAKFGNIHIAQILIQEKVNVNCTDLYERTPLYYAAKSSTEMVEFLLSKGAVLDGDEVFGRKPLLQVLLYGTVDTVQIFLGLPKVDDLQNQVARYMYVVMAILGQKDKLKLKISDIPLLILFTAKNGDEPTFQSVIQACEKFVKSEILEKPTSDAERYFNPVNLCGPYNRTALHYAVKEQLLDVVRFLIKHEADVNAITSAHYTPLHYAASLKNKEMVLLLLNAGADVNAKNVYGTTPLQLVLGPNVLEYELNSFDGVNYEEYFRSSRKDSLRFRNLQEYMFLYKRASNNQKNFVFNKELVKILVEAGATMEFETKTFSDLNIVTKASDDPLLMIALFENCAEIIECILELKTEVKAADRQVYLPLIFANTIGRFKFNERSVLKLLIAFIALSKDNINYPLVSEEEDEWPSHSEWCVYYFGECKLELEKMKEKKICAGKRVSFYDLLTLSFYKVVSIAECEEVRRVLEAGEYKIEFPCYAFLLEKQIERAMSLQISVKKTLHFFQNYAEVKLPLVDVKAIVRYFRAQDFRCFGRALGVRLEA